MPRKVKFFDCWARTIVRGKGCKHGGACNPNKNDKACIACYEAYVLCAIDKVSG